MACGSRPFYAGAWAGGGCRALREGVGMNGDERDKIVHDLAWILGRRMTPETGAAQAIVTAIERVIDAKMGVFLPAQPRSEGGD